MNVSDTLWAISEIFGDRQDIQDGLSFIGVMVLGGLVLIAFWG